ncbi:TraB/GumN family protein [Sneathiella chinensis]|uniref:GumN family protein n=1 Tax=Sneathiella chinensis TaxID=349750 RepID=A0ABQ5U4J9_9PROT|nr:TraB/GumN family protein [Sneathiella chinensis]GLQ06252.1 GumN family protein [Sneathiella chinensis]
MRRIRNTGIALLFALFLTPLAGLAHARAFQPDNCESRAYDNGRLWQVEKPGGPSSFVFGTMHSKDPRILYLPGIVMQAFTSSPVAIFETSLKDENIDTARAMMFGPASFSLKSEIGADRFQQLSDLIQPYGLTPQVLDRLKIWAAASILSQPAPTSSTGKGNLTLLDKELEKSAYQMKKQVVALETSQDQLGLFDNLPAKVQLEYLEQVMKEYPDLEQDISQMSDNYLAGRTGWIFCNLEDSLEEVSEPLRKMMTEDLIDNRNRTMVNRMREHLETGGAFVAIGALHLPGETGVLKLLEAEGYIIRKRY